MLFVYIAFVLQRDAICMCGKALTNDLSKVCGIGPECRRGISPEILANYYRPEVGRVHAQTLGEEA